MGEWQRLQPRWPQLRPGRSLLWPLPAPPFVGLPAEIEVDGLVLQRKREFHATVLDSDASARLRCALQALPAARARAWRDRALQLDWRWRLLGERWLLARGGGGKPDAHSVVERIEQPAQARLRAMASELLGTPLAPPVPHVTLYTHGDATGIGLPDPQRFAERALRRLD